MTKTRKSGTLLSLLMVFALIFSLAVPTYATDTATVDGALNSSASKEVALSLEANKSTFAQELNLTPGDKRKAELTIKNTGKEPIQVTISDITNNLTDQNSKDLLAITDLTINVNGSEVYKGKHDKTSKPVMGWVDLEAGASIPVVIEIGLPIETDNKFQNSNINVKWTFEARADEKEKEVEKTETPSPIETVNTSGREGKTVSDYVNMIGLIVIVAVAVIFIISKIVEKKKNSGYEDDDDYEDDEDE